jgi:hypothetical protein
MAKNIIVSGTGTGASASDTNGGAYEGSVTWTQAQGTNGAALDTASGATVTNNGSSFLRITSAGNFSNSLVDVYVYCDFTATYTDGPYKITAVDASDNYIDIDLAYSADTTANVNVGGALATIGTAMAASGWLVAGDTVKISDAVTSYTTSDAGAIINCTHVPATSRAIPIEIQGVNASDGVIDTANKPLMDCTATVGSGVLINPFYVIENIEMTDGTGNGINSTGGKDSFIIKNCSVHDFVIGITGDDFCTAYGNKVYDNSSHGIQFDNDGYIYNNEVYDNGGVGIDNDGGKIIAYNKVYNNAGAQQIKSNYGTIFNNIVSNDLNDTTLIELDEQNPQAMGVINNTCYGGDRANTVGIKIGNVVDPDTFVPVFNNIIANCGIGISGRTDLSRFAITDTNNFYSNDTNVSNWITGDNAVFGDPDFEDAANQDFSLGGASVAKNVGIGF